MTEKIHFTKMHGIGNDYIYVYTHLYNISDPNSVAQLWSAPHTGIGSDGLVLIDKSSTPEADFTMRIFNADGSEAMMCGNASRCVGKYLYEKGITTQTQIRLLTLSGIKVLNLHLTPEGEVASVTVDMGEPVFEDSSLFNPSEEISPRGTFVSMGNPHYVIFTDNLDKIDVAHDGSSMEYHSAFPQRCNIEYAEVGQDGIRVHVWERGSGITMACGTGACATCVAAIKQGLSDRKNRIIMDGGALEIEWSIKDNHVYMTGPAAFVFEGEIELNQ